MTVSKQLIENVGELRKALNEISVYDLDVYTSMELYYKIANKLNEVIKELARFEGVVSDEVIKQNNKLIYLLGEGLTIEVIKKINQMVEDGTMDSIINHNVFNGLNDKIDEIKENIIDYRHVYNFNAKGDSITDDTQSIQNAVNKSNSVIKFSSDGVYKITEGIEIHGENIILDGNGCTIKAENIHGFILKATSKNITIKNFNFDFKYISDFVNACITSEKLNSTCSRYESACDITIENCKFNGSVFGICLNSATNVQINNNKFYNHIYVPSNEAGGYGVLLQSCYNVKVLNNYNIAGADNRHFCYVSIDQSKTAYQTNINIIIENNYIDFEKTVAKNGPECAINIRESDHVIVKNNYIRRSYGGVYLNLEVTGNESTHIIIDGNRFESIRESKLMLRDCIGVVGDYAVRNLIISNNYFNNVETECFSLKNCKSLTLKNNQINMANPNKRVYSIDSNVVDFLIDGDTIKGDRSHNIYYKCSDSIGRIVNLKKDDKMNVVEYATNNGIVKTTRDVRREMLIYRDYDNRTVTLKKNPENLVNSVTFEEFGFTVKFNFVSVENMDFTFIQEFGELATLQVRSINKTDNTVSFNVKSFDNSVKTTQWKIYF